VLKKLTISFIDELLKNSKNMRKKIPPPRAGAHLTTKIRGNFSMGYFKKPKKNL
jgi:hypothetical protein